VRRSGGRETRRRSRPGWSSFFSLHSTREKTFATARRRATVNARSTRTRTNTRLRPILALPNAERALRCVALGRKNWLFVGSDDGGERAAAIYTLIGTAKLNGLDPEGYLRHVFERIAPDHPINKIDELLPWAVVMRLPGLRLAA
jgi:hypothetical protein